MRRNLVVGNWKMHGSREQVIQLLQGIEAGSAELSTGVEIGVCPPHIHIDLAAELLKSGSIKLGAQNVYSKPEGAFTGEISAAMLAEYGVVYVIVGHSERRAIFSETDRQVALKFQAAQTSKLIPILCVGESLEQRQNGLTDKIVLSQLNAVIEVAGVEALQRAVIAYEPLWAIGTGQTATPEQAQQVHQLLRGHLRQLDRELADVIRIIYGGSVKSANAKDLFSQADIDGGLIGGASLQAEEFISICKSADKE